MYKESQEAFRRLALSNPQAYEPDLAQTQYNLGFLKIDMKCYEEAIPPLEEALSICRRISQVNSAQTQWYENSLLCLSQLYGVVKDYLAAYHLNQEWLPIMKKKYETDPESLRNDYADNLANHSWYCIFAKQYAEAGVIPEERKTDVERIKRLIEE
jgi:tetratricopeptide (TPR) repeat protein